MSRIESVDIFRLIAIVAVITIHTSPFRADVIIESEAYKYLDVIFNQLSRFAVPFFFVSCLVNNSINNELKGNIKNATKN